MLDSMTPSQRATTILKGENADRLPCNPNVANGVARIYGCKISEFNTDAKTLAKAQIASYRRFEYDSIRIFTDLFPWAEAMGASVVKPKDNTVDLYKPAIERIEDVSKIIPISPYKHQRLAVQLEAMKYLVDIVGDEIGCSFGIVGAFTNAFFLLGVEKTLISIRKNPEVIHDLCKISMETIKAYVEEGIKLGLTPAISEPMSSSTVISPKAFREFSLPYIKELVDFIKAKNKNTIIHICGQTNKIWTDISELGVGGMSIDNIASLIECKKLIGDKTKILGNVDPSRVMYSGSPLDVRLNTLECIEEGYDSPMGYVVMSGCSLPIDTPLENIDEMLKTVREVGYPVNINKIESMIEDCKKKMK